MELTEFFNPYNVDHIQAYKVLGETGAWPKDFLPEGVIISPVWNMILAAKCTNAWVEQVLAGHVVGIPAP